MGRRRRGTLLPNGPHSEVTTATERAAKLCPWPWPFPTGFPSRPTGMFAACCSAGSPFTATRWRQVRRPRCRPAGRAVGAAVAAVAAGSGAPPHGDGTGVWIMGARSRTDLQWVWGEYTDDGPEWDIDAEDRVHGRGVDGRVGAGEGGQRERSASRPRNPRLDRPGNGRSLGWNLQKLIGEYARHNGHADLIRERIDGQTGEWL